MCNKNLIKENVIENVENFIKNNEGRLNQHYYSVMEYSNEQGYYIKDNNIYKNIDSIQYLYELLSVSIVITTANFYESEILNYNAYFHDPQKREIKQLESGIKLFDGDFRLVKAYILHIGSYKILHLHAPETGSHTPCGSADLVRYVNNSKYLNPTCIISFGVCYGIDLEFGLGSTIVANKIYPWSIGIKIKDSDWEIKSDDYIIDLRRIDPELFDKITDVLSGAINRCRDVQFESTVKPGNMVTSEAVVSDQQIKNESIEKAHGFKILGGEMEGYGLAKECLFYNHVPCVIIKSICDWGTCKNINNYLSDEISNDMKETCKDKLQAYASFCAFTVLRKLILENIFDNNNIHKKIVNELFETYYNDSYIQEKYLKDFMKKHISEKDSSNKTNNDNDVIKLFIQDLIDNRILKKVAEGKRTGYSFV